MNFERQKRLVERLLERTRSGELSWQESPLSNAFQVSFPNNTVRVATLGGTALGGYEDERYEIAVMDASGRMTDSFYDEQLDRDGPSPFGSWSGLLHELFMAARRKALKADEAIDSILAEIG